MLYEDPSMRIPAQVAAEAARGRMSGCLAGVPKPESQVLLPAALRKGLSAQITSQVRSKPD